MALTLGLTGMDQTTEAALKAAFDDANKRLGRWTLVAEGDADHVIVDMDSMYGPMSWLRLHAAGKKVVGLTSSLRTQADFHLPRPFDTAALSALLHELNGTAEGEANTAAAQTAPATQVPQQTPPVAAAPPAAPASAPAAPASAPAAPTAAPPPSLTPPVAAAPAAPPEPALAPPLAAPEPPSSATVPAVTPPAPVADAAPAEEPPATTTRNTAFAQWLRPGALTGRARFQAGSGPAILIDFEQRQYYGPATLKPLAEYFVAHVSLRDFEQLDDQQWQAEVVKIGATQPLSRLQWLGGLLAGGGKLLPGYHPDGRFALSKWPETEREYPRHFRIATAMMKGPSTIAEITAASSVPAEDVIDFINANLATGFAEQTGEAGKSGGLLDRLRGR